MSAGYAFRISDYRQGGAGSYTDRFYNDPSGCYWKTVGEAREIIKARAPEGARVEYIGYCD